MHSVMYLSLSCITIAPPLSAGLIIISVFSFSSLNAVLSSCDMFEYFLVCFVSICSLVLLFKKVSNAAERPLFGVQPLVSLNLFSGEYLVGVV